MIRISGYRVLEKIFENSIISIYKGERLSEKKAVIIKLLDKQYPILRGILQFRHEYNIINNLNLPGIIRAETLETYGNSLALVMEDNGSIPLCYYNPNRPFDLTLFLAIAVQIASILEGLTSNQIVHKDIKPENIFINLETKEVKLTNFFIASHLPRENRIPQNPNLLEGTLAYMSPEQTGRMNRSIDYRSDFYSVGVTFYQLLTGQLPFQSTDPIDLIHSQIACNPIPPVTINSAIPKVVNDIVLKLMAKDVEERYQSAVGLKHDLEICIEQLQLKENIDPFPLGQKDARDRFVIPEKLYGRELEVKTLLSTYFRIAEGSAEILLVTGFSGIGKTALINEIHKPILQQRGYFIKGKFDQFRRNIPLLGLVEAFKELIQQLLSESSDRVQHWKAQILETLGENGQVIIEVLPELEFLIGKQPTVPELEPNAAQNRFYLMFAKFIRVFTRAAHPLVIFLDDLQWADLASLKLIQSLISEVDIRYLLLIGAYRDHEVSPFHPLMITIDEIQQSKTIINQINLAPLNLSSLNQLVADTLSCSLELAIPLTKLVQLKTLGNPFFAIQFLKFLSQEGIITYNYDGGYWQCDIAWVRMLSISDNVVEFMAQRLEKLPESTQSVLKLAACIGDRFDLNTLAIVYEKPLKTTMADLWRALQEGLVLPVSEIYKFFQNSESIEVLQRANLFIGYRFLHDRVQQAAYFLIPERDKPSTHLKIGQLLLSNTVLEEREERIFDIVNQLNIGRSLIKEPKKRYELAKLNLIAGDKARTSTAEVLNAEI